jgi:regulator of sirC expression with transglutaminase-like and TPR domain
MSGIVQLDHILRLLDDDSEVVKSAVREKLAAMRRDLPAHMARLERPLTIEEERLVADVLEPVRREELMEAWMRWRWLDHPTTQLEEGLSQLSAFLAGWRVSPQDLGPRLDALAEEGFKERGKMDARELAEWLFGRGSDPVRFRGNVKDYYAHQNSNLFWVLDSGLGNPISLSCLYRLVGHRFGLEIEGCNFPGHFLARVVYQNQIHLVDCFNRGRFMLISDVARHHPAANPGMDEILRQPASTDSIILRTLRNLEEAYDRRSSMSDRHLMRKLAVRLMEG